MNTKLLIIGAGPYGLSVAAYAQKIGIDFTILGEPMGFWKKNMPAGMLLRSDVSWHIDPFDHLTLQNFLIQRDGFKPGNSSIKRDDFIEYAGWFANENKIEVKENFVLQLEHHDKKFRAVLDNDEVIIADSAVIAVGFNYFKNLPQELIKNLPGGVFAHTCDLVCFDILKQKKTLIIGGRQAAFEWASLIAASTANEISLIYDRDTPAFEPSDWSWVNGLLDRFLGHPGLFKSISEQERLDIGSRFWKEGRLKLEPWLLPRLKKYNITLFANTTINNIGYNGNVAEVLTGTGDKITCDFVLFATGYKVNISNISFITNSLLQKIDTRNAYPVLDAAFQCSVPGLFFTSLTATQDFGPFFGFVKGAAATAKIIGGFLEKS